MSERVVNDKTAKDYKITFVRMLKTGNLDSVAEGIAFDTYYFRFDTYYFRCAALLYGGASAIRKLIKLIRVADEQREHGLQDHHGRFCRKQERRLLVDGISAAALAAGLAVAI